MEALIGKLCIIATIICYVCAQDTNCTEGSIRLYNTITTVEGEGAVQICFNDTWYAVCDYAWGCSDANVACRELGYTAGAKSTTRDSDYYFGYWPEIRDYYYYCSGRESSLDSCYGRDQSSFYYYYDRCVASRDAAGVRCVVPDTELDACSPNGAVRLANGTATEGRVEYCYNGKWSAICGNFHDEEIAVTCRQLGYSSFGAVVYDSEYRDSFHGYTQISYISCSSYATENKLQECNIYLRGSSSLCNPLCTTPVAIQCYNNSGQCSSGDVRLVGGAIAQEGRIEVCVDGVWGSICRSGWDATSAYVVCRQLGYTHSVPDISRSSTYGYSDLPVVYSYVSCNGWENSITECYKREYLRFYCYFYSYRAGVLCTDGCVENSLRLVGANSTEEGTVEVCVNGIWGYIGDGGWNDADADVVCRQLGLPTGGATAVFNSKKTDRITVHYNYVLCEGTENLLQNCRKVSLSLDDGNAVIEEATMAGVVCAEATGSPRYPECLPKEAPTEASECSSGDVRIMDDRVTLQYCYNGNWTELCTLTHREAMVACKQLGYTDYTWGLIYYHDSEGSSELITSLVKNVSCSGDEKTFNECTAYEGDCLTQCSRSVGLKCFEPTGCSEGDIRLNGGSIEQEGRVEVCVNGVWGSICDYGWDKTDAHVVCKQLGYAELEPVAHKGSTFDEAEGPMIYSRVSCEGWEDNIRKCEKQQYEDFTCPHYTVAGVTCSNECTEGEVRLVNGATEHEGTVEICFNDLWGLISDSNWDDSEADVVCRQLGYSITSGSLASIGSYYGKPNKAVHAGNVRCRGDEETLRQCSMTVYALKEIMASDVDVVGVSCVHAPATSNTSSSITSISRSASSSTMTHGTLISSSIAQSTSRSNAIISNAPVSSVIGSTSSATIVLALVLAVIVIAFAIVIAIFVMLLKKYSATYKTTVASPSLSVKYLKEEELGIPVLPVQNEEPEIEEPVNEEPVNETAAGNQYQRMN